jgi:inosine/xanthosine triphosphatase
VRKPAGIETVVSVIVGSTNNAKLEAARHAFRRCFGRVKVVGLEVDSAVSAQPLGEECFLGARNRALAARSHAAARSLDVDYCLGIEGGLLKLRETWFGVSVVCVVDRHGRESYGTTPMFEMPDSIVQSVLEGRELGDIMGEVSGEPDIRRTMGAVGFLTKGMLTRRSMYEDGIIAALAPFLSADIYRQ